MERFQVQRLLGHLHATLVVFQSGDPEQWISAAESIRYWLNSDSDCIFFDMAEIEHGSMREEGEEEEHLDDDESVDPQDRRSPDR